MSGASYIQSEINRLDLIIENCATNLERHGPTGINPQTFEPMYQVKNLMDAAIKRKSELVIALQGLPSAMVNQTIT